MPVELKGNIVVTGANRGIGLELVKQLAETRGEEAHIYACSREPEGSRTEVRLLHVDAFCGSHINSESTHVKAVCVSSIHFTYFTYIKALEVTVVLYVLYCFVL